MELTHSLTHRQLVHRVAALYCRVDWHSGGGGLRLACRFGFLSSHSASGFGFPKRRTMAFLDSCQGPDEGRSGEVGEVGVQSAVQFRADFNIYFATELWE